MVVIRPLKGIDKCQYQPIVRRVKNARIEQLSPLSISPIRYESAKRLKSFMFDSDHPEVSQSDKGGLSDREDNLAK